MRNTMRKVTIAVPVLITNYQVSLNLKIGPVRSQAATTTLASKNARGRPVTRAVAFANRANHDVGLVGRIGHPLGEGMRPVGY